MLTKVQTIASACFAILLSQHLHAGTCVLRGLQPLQPVKLQCAAFTDDLVGISFGEKKGEGFYGKVYAGILKYQNKRIPVAIKEIQLKSEAVGYENSESLVPKPTAEDARREFKTLLALYRKADLKPYLVSPFVYFEYGDSSFLVMQDGGNALSSMMTHFSENHDLLVKLAGNLFEAIAALHRTRMVHLDLHPGNVLVDESGNVKLIDFGLAKPRGFDVRAAGHRQWRDPHVYVAKSVYSGYDYFSVAAILFEIIVGKKIFDFVASPAELALSPVKPGAPQFDKFVEVHSSLMKQCEESSCSNLYRLVLSLLNPDISQRIPKKIASTEPRTID